MSVVRVTYPLFPFLGQQLWKQCVQASMATAAYETSPSAAGDSERDVTTEQVPPSVTPTIHLSSAMHA